MDLVTMIMACSLYPDDAIVNAMVEMNSQNNPLVISGQPFKDQPSALADAQKLKADGQPFEIGLMQIPSFWLKDRPYSLGELLRPCKNMVLATQILNKEYYTCNGSIPCAISTYKTGDAQSGLDYANQVIAYAKAHPIVRPTSDE